MRIRQSLCATLLLISFLLAAPVLAASRQTEEREARRACLRGNPDKGVEILTDLYLDTLDSNLLYNQGRCFEQNHRYEDAISRFREYLLKAPDLSEAEKAETQKHIAACQSYLGKSDTPAPTPPTPVPTENIATAIPQAPQPSPAPASQAAAVSVGVQQSDAAGKAVQGSGLRAAAVAVGAVGVAAAVTGIVLNVKANDMSKDLEDHYSTSRNGTRETYKTLSRAGYAAGAACIAAGAVMAYFGWSRSSSSAKVALSPAVAPGWAGAVVGGSF